jgi:molecular chaperone HscB
MPGSCWKCHHPTPNVPFCDQCGALQEVSSRLSYFDVLGLEPGLKIELETLRDRFHRLAKQLHPDRFSGSTASEVAFSLRWTTLLNRAYQTLRDPTDRSYYLLELNGVSPEQRGGKIPLNLAETYFELQEMEEGNTEGGIEERLKGFQHELQQQLQATEIGWRSLADRWVQNDSAVQKEVLGDLKENLVKQRYLKSMLQDLQSKLGVRVGDRRN